MAYPVTTKTNPATAAATSYTVPLPAHEAGDVVFVSVMQDGGTDNVLTPPGAPWVVVNSQGATYAAHTVMYAVAAGGALADPTVTSSVSAAFNSAVVVVRDADTTTTINASARNLGAAGVVVGPGITTTEDSCLLLHFVVDPNTFSPRGRVEDVVPLCVVTDSAAGAFVGYSLAESAATYPGVSSFVSTSALSTNYVVVAVNNSIGGGLPPVFAEGPRLLVNYGRRPNPTNLGSLLNKIATISGVPVWAATGFTNTFTPTGEYSPSCSLGGPGRGTSSPVYEHWVGSYHDCLMAVDLTGGAFLGFRFGVTSITTLVGSMGVILVLFDAADNWSAFTAVPKSKIDATKISFFTLQPSELTPIDSSATPADLSNIVQVGWAYHRPAISSGNSFTLYLSEFHHFSGPPVAAKGSNRAPASIRFVTDSLVSGRYSGFAYSFTDTFSGTVFPVQLGRADLTSKISLGSGRASALPLYADSPIYADTSFLSIAPSALDSVDFGYSLISGSGRVLEVSPLASGSATYRFIGASFSNLEVYWSQNVPCDSAQFFDSYGVHADGAVFDGCTFASSRVASAVITSNPGNISDCTFTQGDSGGHAIEITQPGTFAFVGNTFEGYGLDGTTDAAIYNNSGGHVTLNVSGGGDTPTVRNGTGATTDVVSGAQITVVGLAAGSQVKVTKVSNGDVLFNGAEAGGQISFSTTYIGAVRVEARKASASPFYRPWATQATTISGQTVEVTALQELDE